MGLLRKKEDKELRAVVRGAETPHFPAVTLRILKELRDPDVCFERVAECLQWDAGLVVRVLRTVNSAAYGVSRRIDDVRHAIGFMGRSQLEQIVLAIAVKDSLPSAPARGFRAERFWRAAAFRAALARAFADELHPARNAEAFTTGLLQDVAVPVLAHARPDDYGDVLEAWHGGEPGGLEELERGTFGWSHDRVGALLGRSWELPEPLVAGIELHHADERTDREVLPAVRLVARLRETEDEHGLEALIEHARGDYGLDPDWTRAAVADCREAAVELAGTLAA